MLGLVLQLITPRRVSLGYICMLIAKSQPKCARGNKESLSSQQSGEDIKRERLECESCKSGTRTAQASCQLLAARRLLQVPC